MFLGIQNNLLTFSSSALDHREVKKYINIGNLSNYVRVILVPEEGHLTTIFADCYFRAALLCC